MPTTLLLFTNSVLFNAVRLLRHDLPLVKPCWLFPVTTFFTCPETCSRRARSVTVPVMTRRLTRPAYAQ